MIELTENQIERLSKWTRFESKPFPETPIYRRDEIYISFHPNNIVRLNLCNKWFADRDAKDLGKMLDLADLFAEIMLGGWKKS